MDEIRFTAEALAQRRRDEIAAHVRRAIWLSIEARTLDLAGQPAAAADASRDAASHCRCAMFLTRISGNLEI